MENDIYMCIDLKSFYASAECADLGLDPFKTNLVVADPSRGSGAICLAITPAMKQLGVKNRCRIYEIPSFVQYITIKPRMKRYMEVSAHINSIYLRYISLDDMHIYSIDECFIYATPYLKLYNKTAKEFAIMLMDAVSKETHICATAGIGTNMFLAKVALDITAKHVPDHIGYLNEEEFKKQIWQHEPITDIWNIGYGTANHLARLGAYNLYQVTQIDEKQLLKEFGVNGQYLLDHAYGRESCTIKDIKGYSAKNTTMSNGQILFEDYYADDALTVLREMTEISVLEMIEKHKATDTVGMWIGYSKDTIAPTGGRKKLYSFTNSYEIIVEALEQCFKETTWDYMPIRQIGITFNNLADETAIMNDLFTDTDKQEKELNLQKAVINLKNRYGKNSILRAISYQDKATSRKRNKLIGGHSSGE